MGLLSLAPCGYNYTWADYTSFVLHFCYTCDCSGVVFIVLGWYILQIFCHIHQIFTRPKPDRLVACPVWFFVCVVLGW